VARTYHRGVIRKRLLPVNFIHDSGEEVQQAVAPKSEIIEVNSGKKVGTVTTVLGSRGLALLRLEVSLKNTSQLNVKGLENVNVNVIRPKWWPSEWGREEQAAAVA
jgi:folate-binding Fe-S cluster repair protein YgfZ